MDTKFLSSLAPLFLFILLIILILFSVLLWNNTINRKAIAICGTVDMQVDIDYQYPKFSSDTINPIIGKKVFRTNCASCHAGDMKTRLTGPPLEGIMENWNNDTTSLMKYIHNPEFFLEKNRHPRMDTLHLDYGKIHKPSFSKLSKNEIISLIAYIEVTYRY